MHLQAIPPVSEQTAHAPERAAQEQEPLRVKTIAAALRVDMSTMYAEIRAGRLASYRIGQGRGTIRISRQAFYDYLAERGIPASELAVAL